MLQSYIRNTRKVQDIRTYKENWLHKVEMGILRWEKLRYGDWAEGCPMIGFECRKCRVSPGVDLTLCVAGYHSAIEDREEEASTMVGFLEGILIEYKAKKGDHFEYAGPGYSKEEECEKHMI